MSDEDFERQIMDAMEASDLSKDLKNERIRDQAMRSSAFKAIASLEEVPPERWDKGLLDEVIEDVIAVNRVHMIERGWWVASLAVGIAGAFILGWYMKPVPEPEPVQWDCTVVLNATDRNEVDCEGVQ